MTKTSKFNGASRSLCPTCGQHFTSRSAQTAFVFVNGDLLKQAVCADCAAKGTLLLEVGVALAQRSVLMPFATYLRRLALAYQGDRAAGLQQAADVLETGRALPLLAEPQKKRAPERVPELIAEVVRSKPFDENKSQGEAPGRLSPCARAILQVLVARPAEGTGFHFLDVELAIRSGYSIRSSAFPKSLRKLRNAGLIALYEKGITSSRRDRPLYVVTDAGRALDFPHVKIPTPETLVTYWAEQVSPQAGAFLEVLASAYPRDVANREIADVTGYSMASSTFSKTLRALRKFGLIKGNRVGHRASDALMHAAGREVAL